MIVRKGVLESESWRQEEGEKGGRRINREGANDSIPDEEGRGRDDLRQEEGGEFGRMTVRNVVLESESISGQLKEEEKDRSQEEFKSKEKISKIKKIEISQEEIDTGRKEEITKKKGVLEMIKDTKVNLKTERVKRKQHGDKMFIKGLTNNGTGTVRNLVQMFEGAGGQESSICICIYKEGI